MKLLVVATLYPTTLPAAYIFEGLAPKIGELRGCMAWNIEWGGDMTIIRARMGMRGSSGEDWMRLHWVRVVG